MDYEIYRRIKKGNAATLKALEGEELPWAYLVCYRMTGERATAAACLRRAYGDTLRAICGRADCPQESFRTLFSVALYRVLAAPVPEEACEDLFPSLTVPAIDKRFDGFLAEVDRLAAEEKLLYFLYKLGELGPYPLSRLSGRSPEEEKRRLHEIEGRAHPRGGGTALADAIRLSGDFRGSNARLFSRITLPPQFINALAHDYIGIFSASAAGAYKKGKDTKNMNQKAKGNARPAGHGRRQEAAKKKKILLISAVAVLLVVALILALGGLGRGRGIPSTVSTSYKIEEVTSGTVSTTISGSGSLTPLTSKTLTALALLNGAETASAEIPGGTVPTLPAVIVGGTVDEVNVTVGGSVKAGAVIATVKTEPAAGESEAGTLSLVAPYDGVILELYIREGDAISDDTSVMMLMGKDGYTMTLSVDENNISLIELGQEVEIKIDASRGTMPVGEVTDISYNGSSGGSTTSYKITVCFDYVEGTYPGMSVSAEIVIEESEEGLLVPVSAVQTSGDTKYVYLAPSGAALADVYEGDEIDVSDLTKIIVTTGMSDGSYILIESGNLAEGRLIVVVTRTSTETGSSGSGSGSSGGFPGGMGGGSGFPGGGFPGGSFDPSQMPSGFPFGGY